MGEVISPFLRTVFTDLTGGMVTHGLLGRCWPQERDMMGCLESYGLDRGSRACKLYIEEFSECHTLTKQFKRVLVMRRERQRQMQCGTLTAKDYLNPKIDAY